MGIVDLLICLKGSLCHHLWSNRIDSFFHIFFVKTKGQCVYTYFIWLFWGGGGENCVFLFFFLQQKKRSVLHIVPLFDGDECVEMQGMIYDLASFNCERQNALLILEDLRWVIMEDGTGQFSSHRQVWSCADWLAPGRLCRCIAWVAHEFIHHHEAHQTDSVYLVNVCVSYD